MVVTEEHHRVLITSITHLRSEAMRLMPRMEEYAAPLASQLDTVVSSLTGLEHEIDDIQPGQDHDLRNIVHGLMTIGEMLTQVAGYLDKAKQIVQGTKH